MSLIVDSASLPGDTMLAAGMAAEAGGREWRVTVFISRPADQQPVLPGDVSVQLLDRRDHSLWLLAQPSSEWVEAGGAAGTTANGTFRFAASACEPSRIQITWKGVITTLRISQDPPIP